MEQNVPALSSNETQMRHFHLAGQETFLNGLDTTGRYGPTVAIPRIPETYRRLGIKQSFYVHDWYNETYPDVIDESLNDSHELGHHGRIAGSSTII